MKHLFYILIFLILLPQTKASESHVFAVGDIAANVAEVSPELKPAVDAFNLAMGVIGVKNLGKGVVNFAKELPAQTRNLLKENKGLRNLLSDYKAKFKSSLSRSKAYGEFDELDDLAKQKFNEQEKVFDDLLREANATPVHFTQQQIDNYVVFAIKNPNAKKVMLGNMTIIVLLHTFKEQVKTILTLI